MNPTSTVGPSLSETASLSCGSEPWGQLRALVEAGVLSGEGKQNLLGVDSLSAGSKALERMTAQASGRGGVALGAGVSYGATFHQGDPSTARPIRHARNVWKDVDVSATFLASQKAIAHAVPTWSAESLRREVHDVAQVASNENWDGDGARALLDKTVAIAVELVDRLPRTTPRPDVDATPHGEIDFDWTVERGLGLTISVGPEGDIAFAGTFRGAELSGKEPWKGVLPGFVECCLDRLRREAE